MKNNKQNPFEQFEKVDKAENNNQPKEIQKAEIFSALKYGNPIAVKKTGKEIKDQINTVILPFLLSKKEEVQINLSNFLDNAVVLPTCPCWTKIDINEEEFPYKQYSWEETHFVEKSFGIIFKGFGDVAVDEECDEGECIKEKIKVSPYYPQTKEESEARLKYNNLVEDYRDILMDIKTANVLLNTLKDNDEYYLNIEQLVGLKFDKKDEE